MQKIGIIIPCFNTEKTISRVLCSFDKALLSAVEEILVIDNQSKDSTFKLLKHFYDSEPQIARKLSLLQHKDNYGYGGSIQTGFSYFIRKNFSHVMIIHGDNQTDTKKIVNGFLEKLRNDPHLDLILTNRFSKGSHSRGYSLIRRWGNYFFNNLTRIISGHPILDAGAAILCVRTSLLEKISYESISNGFHFHPELNLLFYDHVESKKCIIPMDWRDSEAPPSIRLFQYSIRLLYILFRYRLQKTLPSCITKRHNPIVKKVSAYIGTQKIADEIALI